MSTDGVENRLSEVLIGIDMHLYAGRFRAMDRELRAVDVATERPTVIIAYLRAAAIARGSLKEWAPLRDRAAEALALRGFDVRYVMHGLLDP